MRPEYDSLEERFFSYYMDWGRMNRRELEALKMGQDEVGRRLVEDLDAALIPDDDLSASDIDRFSYIPEDIRARMKSTFVPHFHYAWAKRFAPQVHHMASSGDVEERLQLLAILKGLDFSEAHTDDIQLIGQVLVEVVADETENIRIREGAAEVLVKLSGEPIVLMVISMMNKIMEAEAKRKTYPLIPANLPNLLIDVLGKVNHPLGYPKLRELMAHPHLDMWDRERAAYWLGQDRDDIALALLADFVYETGSRVGIEAIGNIPDEKSSALLKEFRDGGTRKFLSERLQIDVRSRAFEILKVQDELESARYTQGLIHKLKSHKDPLVRAWAALGLGQLKITAALPYLIDAMRVERERDESVRQAAADAYILILGEGYRERFQRVNP